MFVIRAENADGAAEYRATFSDGYFQSDGSYEWTLSHPISMLTPSGSLLGVLRSASVSCHEDPDVSLNFSVLSGNLFATIFTITSAELHFPTLNRAEGRSTAALTLTDLSSNGAAMFPAVQPGAYTTRFNGAPPGGTTFHDSFLEPIAFTTPGGSESASDNFPGGGAYAAISGPVSSISARFHFVMSTNDQASGTSLFRVQEAPAPATLALLGIGALAAARRTGRTGPGAP